MTAIQILKRPDLNGGPPAADDHIDLTLLDVTVDEPYAVWLNDEPAPVTLEFKKLYTNGVLKFVRASTDLEVFIPTDEWETMRSDGRACRIQVVGRGAGAIEDIDPLSLLNPDEPNIKPVEKKKRLLAKKRLDEARVLRFLAMAYDETPAGYGHKGVNDFIKTALEGTNFGWTPSAGALLRALERCGEPGNRSLSAFLSKRGQKHGGQRWPDRVLEYAVEMNATFWAKREERRCGVIAEFYDRLKKENERRQVEVAKLNETRSERGLPHLRAEEISFDLKALPRPSKETLRLWINAGENYWSCKAKYGEERARRRFIGRGRPIKATRALEFVMIDHTRIDAWAVIYDEDGVKVLVERPWLTLALDVYSRMIVGAVITYENPSVYSALLCLRQVVRRKNFLIDRFGHHKGATDGWGKPGTVIVDNGWEFVGMSFQVCCEACGIDVIWAPVKSGEFKSYAERAFGTLNTMLWHRLEEGIPLKPDEMSALNLHPEIKAIHTKEWLFDKMWAAIVTIYHVEPHGEEQIVPAIRWRASLLDKGRWTVDDVTELDKVLGRSDIVLLTAEGVRLHNHRFHDQVITTALLDRLLRFAKKRDQRKGPKSSGTIPLLCTWDSSDCSFIHVWDFVQKKNVRLPNIHPKFSSGLSWKTAAEIMKFRDERNLAFHTDDERYAARAAFSRTLREKIPFIPYRDARKTAAELDRPQLVDGDTVVRVKAPPPIDGSEPTDIPQGLPAREREDDRLRDKAPRRGGAAASRKANKYRARNQARRDAERASVSDPVKKPEKQGGEIAASYAMTTEESLARLAALKKKMGA
ncbi:putative transposase [Bradyrhizobium sp. R2.2-H]|jgi:putative transposase|uniref:integrase catalytic domain-containing protein n=1 Tax=unclassified Bradyrhizobium TaxID=2631580 RepID=UPI001045D9FD|nr:MULTISPECIES: DDE-type integrase/transposase/recombinase [unclassified Bradyrhizobium]TCU63752.1 putative transposase [Bradyrhizobium sp. Y-H1]TCU65736.1 putative transposase [Bradyrhizobium sp. R2.2-H]